MSRASQSKASEAWEQERFDPERLRSFLESALPGRSGPISVLQFRKDHSNLMYLVHIGVKVLRRVAFGARMKSAHDIRSEFTILSALKGVCAKTPQPLAFCDDEPLIGARFYLMERVQGVILRGASGSALFKLALIVQEIDKGYLQGHTRDPRFAAFVHRVRVLGTQAQRALERGRIHGLGKVP